MDNEIEKLDLTFSNGALAKIKELAEYFSIPPTDLKNVLIKGIQVVDEVKKSGNTYFIIENQDGKREKVDLMSL